MPISITLVVELVVKPSLGYNLLQIQYYHLYQNCNTPSFAVISPTANPTTSSVNVIVNVVNCPADIDVGFMVNVFTAGFVINCNFTSICY